MKFFLEKNGYMLYECSSCGLRQTDLKEDYHTFVKRHYAQGYFTGKKQFGAYSGYKTDKIYIQKNHEKFFTKIKKYKEDGKLLDVGCALGFTIELALKHGFDAYGFDPSEYAITEAQRVVGGDRVKQGTIDSVSYTKKSFDVITLFDVFEHLEDPIADVAKLIGYLKDDGIMVIATGNTDSAMAKIMKRRWTFYNPPQHIFFFNKPTLLTFFKRVGLVPVMWFTIGKWLSWQYVLHLARSIAESKVAEMIYGIVIKLKMTSLPIYLPAHDNVVVILRKRS